MTIYLAILTCINTLVWGISSVAWIAQWRTMAGRVVQVQPGDWPVFSLVLGAVVLLVNYGLLIFFLRKKIRAEALSCVLGSLALSLFSVAAYCFAAYLALRPMLHVIENIN